MGISLGNGQFASPSDNRWTIQNTPVVADPGDGTDDAFVVNQNGNILWRKGEPGAPGTFSPPITINPGFASRAIAFVPTKSGDLIASVDLQDNAVSLYAYTGGQFVRVGSFATGRASNADRRWRPHRRRHDRPGRPRCRRRHRGGLSRQRPRRLRRGSRRPHRLLAALRHRPGRRRRDGAPRPPRHEPGRRSRHHLSRQWRWHVRRAVILGRRGRPILARYRRRWHDRSHVQRGHGRSRRRHVHEQRKRPDS